MLRIFITYHFWHFGLLAAVILPVYTLSGQVRVDSLLLQQYDKQIERFESAGPVDSLAFYYKKKAGLFRKANDLEEWVYTYLDLALTDPARMLSFIDSLEARRWRPPHTPEEREALLWCAVYHGYYLKESGDIFRSLQAYERAARRYANFQPENFDVIEYIYKPLGNNYTRLGDNEKAVNRFEKAIALAGKQASSNTLAGLYSNLGLAYWNMGNFDSSIGKYGEGLALPGLTKRNQALLLSNLAASYLDAGQDDKALKAITEAEALFQQLLKTSNSADAQLLSWMSGARKNRGLIRLKNNDLPAAGRTLREALRLEKKSTGNRYNRKTGKIYIALATLEHRRGRYREALNFLNDALASVIPDFQATRPYDNPRLGSLHEENTIFEALEGKALSCQAIYFQEKDPEWLKRSLRCHEMAYQVEKLLWQTYQYQSSKLELQEYSRQRTEKAIEAAHFLFLETRDPALIAKAFRYAEQTKASVLLEAVKENLAIRESNRGDTLFIQEQRLQNLRAYYTRQLLIAENSSNLNSKEKLKLQKSEVDDQLELVTRQIQAEYPVFETLKNQNIINDISNIQGKLINDGEILIEYFEGRKAIYLFKIRRQGPPEMARIPLDTLTEARLDSFVNAFAAPKTVVADPVKFLEDAHFFCRILLEEEPNKDTSRPPKMIVIPDGRLNNVPLEALITHPIRGQEFMATPFMIRNQSIQYVYSTEVLFYQRSLRCDATNALLLLAPYFENRERSLSPLPYSRKEVESLTATIGNSTLLSGGKARLETFKSKAGSYRILHLSTHAWSGGDTGIPRIEFIDSSLYLPELYSMRIPAELVVLSACETGTGTLRRGEGLMSLARGFAYAGTKSMIASLWQVNDAATADIIRRFYHHLSEGKSTAKALQQAKLDYLNDPEIRNAKKAPYYWAGLVLIGHDAVIPLQEHQSFLTWIWIGSGMLLFLVAWWLAFRKK